MPPKTHPLDNPIWNSCANREDLSLRNGKAVCYRRDIALFAALAETSPDAWNDLAALLGSGETAVLFTADRLEIPSGWQALHARWIFQMICPRTALIKSERVVPLSPERAPEMVALVSETEPGPFLPGTIRTGRYFCIQDDEGGLASMAGERLSLRGYTEISAVCTRQPFRRQGFAHTLVEHLAATIVDEGSIPFLHVRKENPAISIYKDIGFEFSREIFVSVIVAPSR